MLTLTLTYENVALATMMTNFDCAYRELSNGVSLNSPGFKRIDKGATIIYSGGGLGDSCHEK